MSPPEKKRGPELSDADEEGPRKRIKLFALANEVEDGEYKRARRIEGLHHLRDSELLDLRNIVVECSTALGGSPHPDPKVVEHLLAPIFDERWTSWKPVGEPQKKEIDEILLYNMIESDPESAFEHQYLLPVGKTNLCAYALCMPTQGCFFEEKILHFRVGAMINGRWVKRSLAKHEGRGYRVPTGSLLRARERFLLDRALYLNMQQVKYEGREYVRKLAAGESTLSKWTPRFGRFRDLAFMKRHFIPNENPNMIGEEGSVCSVYTSLDVGLNVLKFRREFFKAFAMWNI
ncbi:hypothetical protein BN1723_007488 [Verticillium longisporum]|uniref:Uncharacterized protein n=1 Tax=Verticillium longisporum TaxID=100787 RepID=A0A0G4NLQ4_VERLO|nr:hypothetical protein BN1723_007488 [Verticillium longisporum]